MTPRTVLVEGSGGYYRTWTLADVIAALPPGALGREVAAHPN